MTLREFVQRLPRDGWTLDCERLRRTAVGGSDATRTCPVTSLTGQHACVWPEAARRLDLPYTIANAIAAAADNRLHLPPHHPSNIRELRERLLRHCGLATETEAR